VALVVGWGPGRERRASARIRCAAALALGFGLAAPAAAQPFTPVSAVPFTITEPGEYRLVSDLSYGDVSGPAVRIEADGVTLDLAGFALTGTAGSDAAAVGISADGRADVVVRNGRVSGFLFAVMLTGADGQRYRVEDLVAADNWYFGIVVEGSDAVVRDNQVIRTGGCTLPGFDVPIGIAAGGSGLQVTGNAIGETYPPPGGESVGLHLSSAANALVANNVIWNAEPSANSWAVWINGPSTDVLFESNVFVRYENGIVIADPSDGTVARTRGNVFMAVAYPTRQGSIDPPQDLPPEAFVALGGDHNAPACTPIVALPFTIDEQGRYCLVHDLRFAASSGDAILVAADYVLLDLNGFVLDGSDGGAATLANGIHAVDRRNVTVRNGVVRGFLSGVFLEDTSPGLTSSQAHLVEGLRAEGNTYAGVRVQGRGNIIRRNQVDSTSGTTASGPDSDVFGILSEGPLARLIANDVTETVGVGTGAGNAIAVGSGTGTVIERNIIGNSDPGGSYGIRAISGDDLMVVGNRISRTAYGVFFEGGAGKYRKNVTNGVVNPYTGGTDSGNNH
jgi:hypothetical protein